MSRSSLQKGHSVQDSTHWVGPGLAIVCLATLFTDSEVRHVRCDYVMHYSSVRKRRVRNTEKQGEGEIYVKLV